jgi:uncharacterized protein (TIGR00369 family)
LQRASRYTPEVKLPRTFDELKNWGTGRLPGLIGFELLQVENGRLRAAMVIRPELLAPNGYLHAASVIALADTACGYGTIFDLPEEARGFTTIELKSNFLGTCLEGRVVCEASRVHKGRRTQVWDATVNDESSRRKIALFRCTQMILARE